MSDEMIVKEAECGLKEPKPLRVAEMEKAMQLCRGKAPVPMTKEKEKSRRLHASKP